MNQPMSNPFNITKAVDFSDQQIVDTWVDLPTAGGFFKLADPTSPMPLLLLGGKGSGRTHLMRYFSFPVQSLRRSAEPPTSVLDDGYLGIYLRCSGLNAGRFSGKGQDEEVWGAVFSYYMDLWIAQLTLSTYRTLISSSADYESHSSALASGVMSLLDWNGPDATRSIEDVLKLFHSLQRELDVAINNAAITRKLDVTIRATRGQLVFGIPQVAAKCWPNLQGIQLLYLLDEYENLTVEQQRYINTLVREKEAPSSFFIGSRLYGVRTLETYSAGEENKEGSEFESLRLDSLFIRDRDQYADFARRIVAQRLIESGYSSESRESLADHLDQFFEDVPRSQLGDTETDFVAKSTDHERPYFRELANQLREAVPRRMVKGLNSIESVEQVIELLEVPAYPLIEKTNCFLLYRAWSKDADLLESAHGISADAADYIATRNGDTKQALALEYFRSDLFAQLLRDYRQPQRYVGLNTFIDMSGGLLRNLLIVLKDIFRWSSFNGEDPFRGEPITMRAQREGVREAADWFFNDAQFLGTLGDEVRDGVVRLGNLLRRMRFSDKPSESSLISFSTDLSKCTIQTRLALQEANAWSLLVEIGTGQRDRNSAQIDAKYQMNPMLCPRWDLPIHRRGTVSFSPKETDAIFGPQSGSGSYEEVASKRLVRLNAPFRKENSEQELLPGFDHA